MNALTNDIIHILEQEFVEKSSVSIKKLQSALKQHLEAFGGCDICWGRGYLDITYTYCKCSRGQQLENVKALLKKEKDHG